jgi:hypothetical protein
MINDISYFDGLNVGRRIVGSWKTARERGRKVRCFVRAATIQARSQYCGHYGKLVVAGGKSKMINKAVDH